MCDEKKRLLQMYEQLESASGKILSALNHQASHLSKADYDAMLHTLNLARLEAERARITFDAHVIEHKC